MYLSWPLLLRPPLTVERGVRLDSVKPHTAPCTLTPIAKEKA